MSDDYATGFAAGELAAFTDRRTGAQRTQLEPAASDYQRGFWDGYRPRAPQWNPRDLSRLNEIETT